MSQIRSHTLRFTIFFTSRAGRFAVFVLALLAGGCGLDYFDEDEARPAKVSANTAQASMQTYAVLLARQKRQETLQARQTESLAAAEAESTFSKQIAALPPANEPGIALRVHFPPGEAELPETARADLAALAAQLMRNEVPLHVLAYWRGAEQDASQSKLYAFKRALKVRSALHDMGLETAQIVFQQVGDEDQPLDLVDVVLAR